MPNPERDPFHGSHLKVKRAKQHIGDLKREIDDFRKRRPYRVVVEFNGKATQDPFMLRVDRHDFTIRVREDVPDPVPLQFGDAIHNLRSALDHAICDAVRKRGGTVTTKHKFPIFKEDPANGQDLKAAINSGGVDEAGPEVVQVVRSINPSDQGNPKLWALHHMDIDDKHKLLLVVAVTAGIPDMQIRDAAGRSVLTMLGTKTGIRDGAIAVSVPALTNVKLGQEADLPFEVEFPRGSVFERHALVPTLIQLTELVEGIVKRIAAVSKP